MSKPDDTGHDHDHVRRAAGTASEAPGRGLTRPVLDARIHAAATLVIIAVVLLGLAVGRPLLVPLALAVILWYLLSGIAHVIQALPLGGGRHPPGWISWILSPLFMLIAVMAVIDRISGSVSAFTDSIATYTANLNQVLIDLSGVLGVDVSRHLEGLVESIDVQALVSEMALEVASVVGSVGLIIIYVAFIAFETSYFQRKINLMVGNPERRAATAALIRRIQADIRTYVLVKTVMSVLTGGITWIVLMIVGLDFAFLWGFIIFLLNYIPTIGSLLGALFPALMAMLQFGGGGIALLLLLILGFTQFFIGNVLEPRVMGSSLNLSPLVVMLSLALWGMLWGITGMLLCVPITVIAVIVLANFPSTRNWAILLSQNGRVMEAGRR
ncbi:MAG: AI-2E family transporter [Azospirillaceae bacterium]